MYCICNGEKFECRFEAVKWATHVGTRPFPRGNGTNSMVEIRTNTLYTVGQYMRKTEVATFLLAGYRLAHHQDQWGASTQCCRGRKVLVNIERALTLNFFVFKVK